ncbi:hypothetical protein [uncultured Clostridium sp.]|uniref:hypothetical protein n=1 Tax=uncultured Clostridium sp. TaxID=59620 RepID=UPI002630AC0F|nr:hypothetical protein [uncultured Clostridium sp.]
MSHTITVGQQVNYSNGNLGIYTGQVMEISNGYLVVVDLADVDKWSNTYAISSFISPLQVIV